MPRASADKRDRPATRGTLFAFGILALIGAGATVITFMATVALQRETARSRLEAQANESTFQITRRYESAVTLLRTMRGLYYGSDQVRVDEFDTFIETSGFREVFPQFGVVAYAKRVRGAERAAFEAQARGAIADGGTGFADFAIQSPDGRDEYWPVVYAIPMPDGGEGLGWDLLNDPVRLPALERARDLGDAAVSGDAPVHATGKVGALFVVPMYATKDVPKTLEARRESFTGALGVSFSYEDFPLGALATDTLNQRGISVAMGPQGAEMAFFRPTGPQPRLASLYGELTVVRKLQLNATDQVDITYRASAAGLLSGFEHAVPFGVALTVLFASAAALLRIALMRRTSELNSLRQRYEFTSTISHQLRTPITKMRWALDAATESSAGGDRESMAAVKNDVLALNAIIEDLLLFLEWGEMRQLDRTAVNTPVSGIVDDALARIEDPAKARRVSADLGGAGSASILAQRNRLSTALWFLVDNALTYSPEGSPVSITAALEGPNVTIRVIDRGYGIPKTEQDQVWSYFYRGTNASLGKNAGSGVGIPLCAVIVHAHGGSVDFTSDENKGTTFTITLPVVR